jgi:hypothetical protein
VRDHLRLAFDACQADQQARLRFLSVHIEPNPFADDSCLLDGGPM